MIHPTGAKDQHTVDAWEKQSWDVVYEIMCILRNKLYIQWRKISSGQDPYLPLAFEDESGVNGGLWNHHQHYGNDASKFMKDATKKTTNSTWRFDIHLGWTKKKSSKGCKINLWIEGPVMLPKKKADSNFPLSNQFFLPNMVSNKSAKLPIPIPFMDLEYLPIHWSHEILSHSRIR